MSAVRDVQVAGPVIAFGGILLAIAGVALWTVPAAPELDGHLEFWRPKPSMSARLEEVRAQRAAAPIPADTARALGEAWRAASAAPYTPGPSPRRRIQSAEQRFLRVAKECLETTGLPAYGAAGEALAGRFIAALDVLAEVAGEEHKGTWLATHEAHPAAREVRGLGGDFLERALATGLLPPSGPLDPGRREVARVLWSTHWFETARRGLAAEAMSPEERLLVRLWKVEDSLHLSWQRRCAILEEVRVMAPDYPADYVEGVLATREGLLEEARVSFQRALDAGYRPAVVRRWLAWLAATEVP